MVALHYLEQQLCDFLSLRERLSFLSLRCVLWGLVRGEIAKRYAN